MPQAHLNGRRIPQPRGRVVGGSGSINGMVYSRGNPRDYADWVAAGASGWSYAEVLPYFLRSENNQDLPASPLPRSWRTHECDAAARARISSTAISSRRRRAWDFPAPTISPAVTNEGVGFRQGVIRGGQRETTARAFLRPALARGNVALYTDALVLRVIVEARPRRGRGL